MPSAALEAFDRIYIRGANRPFRSVSAMIIALLAATVLMADSATALQAAPAASGVSPTTAAPNAGPKKAETTFTCHREAALGTRLPTKRCRSPAQTAEQQHEDRANLEKPQVVTPERTN
jgi:hypothetical protein